jgi:hypothetical protein
MGLISKSGLCGDFLLSKFFGPSGHQVKNHFSLTAAVEGFVFGKTLPEHGMSGQDNAALCYRILQCLASKGKTVPTKVLSFVL